MTRGMLLCILGGAGIVGSLTALVLTVKIFIKQREKLLSRIERE